MDVGDALRTKALDHLESAITKYYDGGYDGHVTLEHEGNRFNADCHIHLDTGMILQASADANDATSAFETAAGHIEKRLRRYKRKLKNHRRAAGVSATSQSYVLASPELQEEVDEDFSPAVIAETTSNLHSMSVGEAVMELDLTQQDVMVFRHAGHGRVNVVYRRADGNIGWVDPEPLDA